MRLWESSPICLFQIGEVPLETHKGLFVLSQFFKKLLVQVIESAVIFMIFVAFVIFVVVDGVIMFAVIVAMAMIVFGFVPRVCVCNGIIA